MGGYATLHFGLRYARMARSLTVVGAGFGSDPDKRAQFLRDTEVMARRFEELGTPEAIKVYQIGPARVQLATKDPRGFREFCEEFAGHSALGSANTLRGVQARRPTIYSLARALARMKVPTHIISGDEDNNCLEPGLFIKRVCPAARLTVVPATGHAVNFEEPDFFNRLTGDFLALVDSGRWRPRDPRSLNKSTMAKRN
jgi:pimeloyl-ACP methyl ester carboxylesterase